MWHPSARRHLHLHFLRNSRDNFTFLRVAETGTAPRSAPPPDLGAIRQDISQVENELHHFKEMHGGEAHEARIHSLLAMRPPVLEATCWSNLKTCSRSANSLVARRCARSGSSWTRKWPSYRPVAECPLMRILAPSLSQGGDPFLMSSV
jgi:hypothetical protein